MLVRLASVLSLASLSWACSSPDPAADPPDAADGGACPVASSQSCASPPSYRQDVSPIIDTYCNNCHSATVDGGPWPLGGYDNVHDWKELMVIDLLGCDIPGIAKGHSMPPIDASAPLPQAQRDVVVSWLLCDAPDN